MAKKKIKLTKKQLDAAISNGGSLGKKQFNALGYQGVFKGWRKALVGRSFTKEQIELFMSLKNSHRKRHKLPPQYNQASNPTKPPVKSQPKTKPARKLTPINPYDTAEWNRVRKEIYERDGFKCRKCGTSGIRDGVKLFAHHLLYIKDKPLWDVPEFYLITLCYKCHKEEHSKRLSHPRKIY